MENKAAILIIVIIFIIAITGLVLFFKTSMTGEYAYKPYTHQEIANWYPYSQGRTIKGGVPVLPFVNTKVEQSATVYAETNRSAYRSRYPEDTKTALETCAGNIALGTVPEGYTESATYIEMKERYYQNCVPAPKILAKTHIEYCCKRPRT